MPTSIGTEAETLLIDQHWDYGGRVHDEVAAVLVEALRSGTNVIRGHSLFTRLYQEQFAALEDFGAWAWALRERQSHGFLSAYLRYQVRDLRVFWRIIREHEGDLVNLLRLPSREDMRAVLETLPRTERTLDEILAMRLASLSEGADQFFATDEIVISVYNKLKHGIPIIRRKEATERQFEVLLFKNGVSSARFEITGAEIRKIHRNTEAWTVALRDLAGLTKILLDGKILYA